MPCRAVPHPVFGCDVMHGQVPVEAAIGDSFPATALSLLPRKGASKVGDQADREGKARKEKICKWEDSQSGDKHATLDYTPLQALTLLYSLYPTHGCLLWLCSEFLVTIADRFSVCCLHARICECEWLTVDSSALLFHRDTHNPDTDHLTHFDSSTAVQYAPDLSAPSLLSSLLLARLCPPAFIPCDRYYLSLFPPPHTPRYTHIHTQINRHRNIFINTDTHTVPWSRRLHIHTNIHTRAHIHTHALAHEHTYTHLSCDVWCAMGSRWVESQCWLSLHWAPQGVFIVAKINKATVTKHRLDHTHTPSWAHTYIHDYVRTCTQAYSCTHKKKNKKEKKENDKNTKALTHTHTISDKSSQKHSRFDTQKTRAQLDNVFCRTHTCTHTDTLHKLSRTVTVQKRK